MLKRTATCMDCETSWIYEAKGRIPTRCEPCKKIHNKAYMAEYHERYKSQGPRKGSGTTTRNCPRCLVDWESPNSQGGQHRKFCPDCRFLVKQCSRCEQILPLDHDNFNYNRTHWTGFSTRCRPCDIAGQRRWTDSDATAHRRSNLKKMYGITIEDFDAMLAEQGGGCAICGSETTHRGKSLAVDHCHDSGEVRGVLCGPCNSAIGLFREDQGRMLLAIEYLKKHSA